MSDRRKEFAGFLRATADDIERSQALREVSVGTNYGITELPVQKLEDAKPKMLVSHDGWETVTLSFTYFPEPSA
jgi:hypothetical protein